jgi:superfamily I DNA/RNA helicase
MDHAWVSGSAGTGKSVVAVHRAAYLARLSAGGRLLLATFSKTLASRLSDGMDKLLGAVSEARARVAVLQLHAYADKVAQFLQYLKPLQDDLGYNNDVRVANELLATLQVSGDVAGIARAAGIVIGWHDRGLADHDRKLRKRARRLRHAQPFW